MHGRNIEAHQGCVLRAFSLSFAQLGDPAILRVLAKTLALTLAVFLVLYLALWRLVDWLISPEHQPGITIAVAAALVGTILSAWILFRSVSIAILGLFADEVVVAVEKRHYSQAAASARIPSWSTSVRMSAASAGRAITLNLLALPLYLVFVATGIGTVLLFAALNGWLLGRDLGEMVAVRHMPRAAIGPEMRATGRQRFVLGLATTGLFVVPGLNLVAPVVGAAAATHLFHERRMRT